MMRSLFIISIGQKFLLGITGLGLAVFVLMHMLGNLLLFMGDKVYNLYSYQLMENPLIEVFEIALCSLFLMHIAFATFLTIKNFKAKKIRNFRAPKGIKATAWYQKSLIAQGAIILVFVILHLIQFKYGSYYEINYGDKTIRDLYRLVIEAFQNPLTCLWYIIALLILCVHLFHGLSSSIQSLGLIKSDKAYLYVKKISLGYAVLVTIGYIALPIYVFCFV